MAINKVIFGNTTLMDTTGVTVTPDKMVLGTTALSASGDTITGTLGPATQSIDGLMSATDKAKLDDANACAKVGPSAIASISDAYAADAIDITIAIEPVQSGSGEPSPTNVRPISGWTGANVTRTGKNLLNVPDRSITYSGNTYTSSNGQIAIQQASKAPTSIGLYSGNVSQYGPSTWDGSTFGGAVFVKAGQTFTLSISISSLSGTPVSGRYMFPYVYYADGTRANFSYITGTGLFTLTRTAPADVVEVFVWISNATSQVTAEFTAQLEIGSTATPYEPYQGTTYDITFPTEAGTVYGGTLDVTTGLLTVDRGNIASYAGETLPGAWISSMDVYTAGGTPTTGAQVVYELATPQTYQLTPTQIALLEGANNVWADTGDTTVAYLRADSLCINRAIAARLDGLDMLGFYIDNSGYICQRIGSDT